MYLSNINKIFRINSNHLNINRNLYYLKILKTIFLSFPPNLNMQKSPTDRNCFARSVQKLTCQITIGKLKRKRDSQHLGAKETLYEDK